MNYRYRVERTLETFVEFSDDDLLDGDTPEDAAMEISLSYSEREWDELWMDAALVSSSGE